MSEFIVVKCGNAEDRSDGIPMGNGGEREREVLPKYLGKPFGDEATFEAGDLAVFVPFDV